VPGAERRHPRWTDSVGVGWCRVVAQERQGDVPVEAGEQLQHRRVVDLHYRPQLVLHVALVPDQPFPITGQRPQLGQRSKRET
jgi:hypothetical protein